MPPKEIIISLNSGLNPFFSPHREILKNQTILFTDMNERGEIALLKSIKTNNSSKKYSSINWPLKFVAATFPELKRALRIICLIE